MTYHYMNLAEFSFALLTIVGSMGSVVGGLTLVVLIIKD